MEEQEEYIANLREELTAKNAQHRLLADRLADRSKQAESPPSTPGIPTVRLEDLAAGKTDALQFDLG
eukprot:7594114-Pyramimonas_sp.AAC.1